MEGTDGVETQDSSTVNRLLKEAKREIDPAAPDMHSAAFYAPLFFRFKRKIKYAKPAPAFSDYFTVTGFLLLEVSLQLLIAYKLHQISNYMESHYVDHLFKTVCWQISHPLKEYYVQLLPLELHKEGDYDCLMPTLVAVQSPKMLDLNGDGFWSVDEAHDLSGRINNSSGSDAESIGDAESEMILQDMIKYDNEAGNFQDHKPGYLNMSFFQRYSEKLRICVLMDPELCGNFESQGYLKRFMTANHSSARIHECRSLLTSFCRDVFGEKYKFLYRSAVSESLCGAPSWRFESGISLVSYAEVGSYLGKPQSVMGVSFASLLAMMVFIWIALVLNEIRQVFYFLFIVWKTPSTAPDDPEFARLSETGKMRIVKLPIWHKAYTLLLILPSHGAALSIVFYVGLEVFYNTTKVIDLVFNGTALAFLMQVRDLMYQAFLGRSFTDAVIDRCEALTATFHTGQAIYHPWLVFGSTVPVLAATMYWAYESPHGFKEIASATECLCHVSGPCLAKRLLDSNA